jgi:hypothetical protein
MVANTTIEQGHRIKFVVEQLQNDMQISVYNDHAKHARHLVAVAQ